MELHQDWQEKDSQLIRTVRVPDFIAAVALVTQIAELAEAHNHHPDISIHNYSQVTISLTSHDTGTITERDRKLASALDAIL